MLQELKNMMVFHHYLVAQNLHMLHHHQLELRKIELMLEMLNLLMDDPIN
jgi:hypothetical protein